LKAQNSAWKSCFPASGQKSFASRDEQEVAGYADAMDMVFGSLESITITENHIQPLHGVLLTAAKIGSIAGTTRSYRTKSIA
jgi:hypothetical protein